MQTDTKIIAMKSYAIIQKILKKEKLQALFLDFDNHEYVSHGVIISINHDTLKKGDTIIYKTNMAVSLSNIQADYFYIKTDDIIAKIGENHE